VTLSVCLSVNTITPEPLVISSRNFQGIILWSKGQTCLKIATVGCVSGDLTSHAVVFVGINMLILHLLAFCVFLNFVC